MAGPYLPLREGLGALSIEAWRATISWPQRSLIYRKWPMARRDAPPLAGVYGLLYAGPCVLFEPPYVHATEDVGPGDGIQ